MIGSCLHAFWGGFLFGITFLWLRKYAGGFHFPSLMLCIPFSIIIEGIFLILAATPSASQILFIVYIPSAISLIVFSPIMSSKRILSRAERRHCKVFVLKLIVILSIICYTSIWFEHPNVASFPMSAVIMVSVSQYPALLVQIKHKRAT